MHEKRRDNRLFTVAAGLVTASAILYCSWPLGFWLNPVASRTGLASELGAIGQPYNWVFIWGDIVSGALLVAGVGILIRMYRLTSWARIAMLLLALYGICGALDAAFPMHCLPSEEVCGPVLHNPELIVHGIFDLTGSVALIGTLVASAVHVHKNSPQWQTWIYVIGIGGTLFAIISGIFYITGGPGYWAQRYYITLSCIWVASIPFVLRPNHAKLEKLNH